MDRAEDSEKLLRQAVEPTATGAVWKLQSLEEIPEPVGSGLADATLATGVGIVTGTSTDDTSACTGATNPPANASAHAHTTARHNTTTYGDAPAGEAR